MNLKLLGQIAYIGEIENKGKEKEFLVREMVVKTQEQYPQPIKFQMTQDKCNIVEGYELGDLITVHFDIRGNEWNGRIFNNLNAWKIEKKVFEPLPTNSEHMTPKKVEMPSQGDELGASEDDLPF